MAHNRDRQISRGKDIKIKSHKGRREKIKTKTNLMTLKRQESWHEKDWKTGKANKREDADQTERWKRTRLESEENWLQASWGSSDAGCFAVVTHRLYSAPRNKFSGFLHTLHSAEGRHKEHNSSDECQGQSWHWAYWAHFKGFDCAFCHLHLPCSSLTGAWIYVRARLTEERPSNSSVTKQAPAQTYTAGKPVFELMALNTSMLVQGLTIWVFIMWMPKLFWSMHQ